MRDGDLLALISGFATPLALLFIVFLFFVIGTRVERGHIKRLVKREGDSLALALTSFDRPSQPDPWARYHLVTGCAVVSIDRFKAALYRLRGLFGGRQRGLESLVERARREALCQLRAAAIGAVEVIDVHVETAEIGAGAVEALAFGTAVYADAATGATTGATTGAASVSQTVGWAP